MPNLRLKAFFFLLMFCLLLRPFPAAADDEFVVKSVSTHLNETVFFLNVVSEIHLPDYIIAAFEQGFDIPLLMEVEVYRHKRLWFDEEIVYIKQQYLVKYHPMLDAVSVLNVNAGRRFYYKSLEEGINSVTVILGYPLLDNNNLINDQRYRARLRVGIDVAELPIPLKSSSLWDNNWRLVSNWHKWEVSP